MVHRERCSVTYSLKYRLFAILLSATQGRGRRIKSVVQVRRELTMLKSLRLLANRSLNTLGHYVSRKCGETQAISIAAQKLQAGPIFHRLFGLDLEPWRVRSLNKINLTLDNSGNNHPALSLKNLIKRFC